MSSNLLGYSSRARKQESFTDDLKGILRHFLCQEADPNSAGVSELDHSSASSFCIARLVEL